MYIYHLLTILVIITTVFAYLNYKLFKWPATIGVTIFSLSVSVLLLLLKNTFPRLDQVIESNIERIHFNNIVMNVVLGFLLFSAAFKTDVTLFRKYFKIIVSMALLGTLLSTFIVGTLTYYLFSFFNNPIPYMECLVFGALISPTDPVAAIGVLRKIGISKKSELKVTGEALINDGISIVIFTVLLNIASSGKKTHILSDALLLFLREAGGAVLFGSAIGLLALFLLKFIHNYKIEILVTLSVVMGGYTLAQYLEVSSPISMVIAGMFCSTRGRKSASHISKDDVITFWNLVEDFINVVLFMIIGIELFIIPLNKTIIFISLISVLSLLAARYLSLLPIITVFKKHFDKYAHLLFTWAALRGAVSIALALSLPAANHRAEFLSVTYIIAVFSIIVQGLTIKPFAKKLGIGAS